MNHLPAPVADYPPIDDHGAIGDLHTVALVTSQGAIDWCCLPRFDSPAVFASLIDAGRGGSFSLAAESPERTRQMYLPDSNVLLTRFLGTDWVAEVVDFMVPRDGPAARATDRHVIVRRARAVHGRVTLSMRCQPSFDFARAPHRVEPVEGVGAVFRSPAGTLVLRSSVEVSVVGIGGEARFELEAGQTAEFILEWEGDPKPLAHGEVEALLQRTLRYWQGWLRRSRYQGRWREMVERSALCLKLLVFQPTGALVAAPTTSLPEALGHGRNWDYRYTWIRDAAFTVSVLMRLGFTDEAGAFLDWLESRCRECPPGEGLQTVYRIDGSNDLGEEVLGHLSGYQGSSPVRVGNGAARQLQLDIYGELMDAVAFCDERCRPVSWQLWNALCGQLEWLVTHWREPDHGIWEPRIGRQRFTHSTVMTWVAFTRALSMARRRGLPASTEAWAAAADNAYREVQGAGWDDGRRSYVQFPGTDRVDAALLVMPLVGFLGAQDPRFLATLNAIDEDLVTNTLVRRYPDDGWDELDGREGTFSLCTFWFVEALARAGRIAEARLTFEKMLTFANHVGLYAEQIGPSGDARGNFPQAFTHLALISAALELDGGLHRRSIGTD